MYIDFTGKVVLITGGNSGIGAATALLFAKLGAKLALVGRNKEKMQHVAAECEKERGLKPLQILIDLTTDEGPEKVAKETINHFGRLDVLINNAGTTVPTNIQRTDMESFDTVFRLVVRASYNLTRLLVPELIKAKGNIVNVSSIAATAVVVGNLPYAMAKAALNHFSREIALELAPLGVRVNTVCPGVANTKLVQRVTNFSDEELQSWLKRVAALTPMGEIIEGLDVAKMIAHLVSDHSRLVTGVTVYVDAGMRFSAVGPLITELMK